MAEKKTATTEGRTAAERKNQHRERKKQERPNPREDDQARRQKGRDDGTATEEPRENQANGDDTAEKKQM